MTESKNREKIIQSIPQYSDWQWSFAVRVLWLILGIVGGGACVIIIRNFLALQIPEKVVSSVIGIILFSFCCVPMVPIVFGRLSIDKKRIKWTRFYSIKKVLWENVKAIKGIRKVTAIGHSYYMLRLVLSDDTVEGVFSTSEEARQIFKQIQIAFSELKE